MMIASERKQTYRRRGATLVEVMVASIALAVLSLGGLSYQYLAVAHSNIARSQVASLRAAQLVLENWKSTGGSPQYDPSALGLGIRSTSDRGANYSMDVGDITVYLYLSSNDVSQDDVTGIILRKISVGASYGWLGDPERGIRVDDTQSVVLTTYIRVDASGG